MKNSSGRFEKVYHFVGPLLAQSQHYLTIRQVQKCEEIDYFKVEGVIRRSIVWLWSSLRSFGSRVGSGCGLHLHEYDYHQVRQNRV